MYTGFIALALATAAYTDEILRGRKLPAVPTGKNRGRDVRWGCEDRLHVLRDVIIPQHVASRSRR